MKFDYRFELGPFPDLPNGYFHKIAALRSNLSRYSWIIWVDDDAFITNPNSDIFVRLIEQAESRNKSIFIAHGCDEELNGSWAYINSGVFGVKNDSEGRRFLDTVWGCPLESLQEWWDCDKYGVYTAGDQDAILWALKTQGSEEFTLYVDEQEINSRSWYYKTSSTDRFICHFPGAPDKHLAVAKFEARFNLDSTLIPPHLLTAYAHQRRSTLSAVSVLKKSLFVTGQRGLKRVRLKMDWIREHRRWN